MAARRFKFTETTGAGVYTASMRIPANSIVRVHWVHGTDWTATTSAVLRVTVGAEVLYNDVDLKAAGPFAPASNGFDAAAAADKIGTVDVAVNLTATVTTVGAAGSAGRGELVAHVEQATELAAQKA